ncbi:hypothetical protein [Dyadobacter sp. CY356]|uniref:hypothetical protein n=1 Tax=Dyadobacter sp. CY356 TaxID=2906442 RepID=UPI001F216B80|nr:hypothetical protein [Dyadobacter sp. CY356]MCF0056710.1 hypothetical protein [Dyadobacter sp. CY356]
MKTIANKGKSNISRKLPDISNDSFFLQKKQNAIEFLKQHPIPENLLKKQKAD